MAIDLPFIWAGIIAFAVLAYVMLDGFDLGIGILFPSYPARDDRDLVMNSVAPVWDGNETWLVLGGGGLIQGLATLESSYPSSETTWTVVAAFDGDVLKRLLRIFTGQPVTSPATVAAYAMCTAPQ